MLKKTITYVDFNGDTRTEDCYFHMSKVELSNMVVGKGESLSDKVERLIQSKDNYEILTYIQDIILSAYGEKSEDGRFFKKNEEIRKNFESSPMYEMLYIELCNNAEKAAEFIKGVLPKDLAGKVDFKDADKKIDELTNQPIGIK